MGQEIERKYLLKNDLWRPLAERSVRMKQRYLPLCEDAGSGRVRIAGDHAFLTLKTRVKGFSRGEFEYEIPIADAEQIMDSICTGPTVEKMRYIVPFAGHVWEIDEFAGANAGLILAEIELRSETETFELPPWIGGDVTGDVRYYNSVLAEHPYSEWKML